MPTYDNAKGLSRVTLQWAPTLTSHDPNPPITLETAAAAATDDPSAKFLMMSPFLLIRSIDLGN